MNLVCDLLLGAVILAVGWFAGQVNIFPTMRALCLLSIGPRQLRSQGSRFHAGGSIERGSRHVSRLRLTGSATLRSDGLPNVGVVSPQEPKRAQLQPDETVLAASDAARKTTRNEVGRGVVVVVVLGGGKRAEREGRRCELLERY